MTSPERKSPQHPPQTLRANIKTSVPSITPLGRLFSVLYNVKPGSAPGTWLASCPTAAHTKGDRSRGLSIRETDDGTVLIHCHAGCDVHAVLSAVGLQAADLFPPRPETYPNHPPHRGITGKSRAPRIAWADLFQSLEHDMTVCGLAFGDLAAGVAFTPEDAASIARLANHLADEIREARHAQH